MSFGKTKRRLKALINRKDFTDELAGDFIQDAQAEIERRARIGAMETLLTAGTWDGTHNALPIPGNYIELIRLFTDTGELTQVDMGEFLSVPTTGCSPTHFTKVADRWLLRPTPPAGSNVYVHFYGQSGPLLVDTDQNIWTSAGLNALVYAAAVLAADFYQMEDNHAARFSSRAADFLGGIQDQDHADRWAGGLAIPHPQNTGAY